MIAQIKKSFFALSVAVLSIPATALAQFSTPTNPQAEYGISDSSIAEILSTLLQGLLALIAVVAIIAFVVAGILYLTSGGDEERAKNAKNVMIMAIIGVIVALLGYVAVNTVSDWLVTDSPNW